LTGIPGSPPDLAHPPAGCRFSPRCPLVKERCTHEEPALYAVSSAYARCLWHAPDSLSVTDRVPLQLPVETA